MEDVLGIGGMGVVVRASHLELDTQVAIKFLLPHMAEDANVVQRFLREAQATVRLKGEHIAKVTDVGKLPDGSPFMVMEYLSGADLGQVLKAHGAQPAMVACELMLQICEGMAEAHALGIVHRDVKPSNFFVTRRPDGSPLVKILDFGISKVPVGADLQLTGTQSTVGTPTYMAPEHMRAASRADQRSDLWSMGVVLYQLLTDRLPFEGESYAELCLKVGMDQPAPISVPLPFGLNEVLLRCLEKEPEQRYQSVAQLAYALAPFCSDPVVAIAAADRCGRILEAPRGPRAPTLPVGSLGYALGPLTPYSTSSSRPLLSYPTSISAGAGEIAPAPPSSKGVRMALYGAALALILSTGVGLGISASGSAGPSTSSESSEISPAASAPAALPEPAAPTAPTEPATPTAATTELQGGAEVEPAATATTELQGGAEVEPTPVADLAKTEASGTSPPKAGSAAIDRPATAAVRPARTKPKAKPKKKSDLFQSRE